jgi:ferrous iron transport protein B
MNKPLQTIAVPMKRAYNRGTRPVRFALLGLPNSGKSTLFKTVASTAVQTGELAGTHRTYGECAVQVGLDQVRLVDLPSIPSLHGLERVERVTLQYLLWGDERAPIAAHESGGPPAPFAPPDVIIQVMDATALARHLELTLELSLLGLPVVIALNMMDDAARKGLHINHRKLSKQLGIPVVPVTVVMGQGIMELFTTALNAVRKRTHPLPPALNKHLAQALEPLSSALNHPEIHDAFRMPHALLLSMAADDDAYFRRELAEHFGGEVPHLQRLRAEAEKVLPRPLAEELHADRHHQAASLAEDVIRTGAPYEGKGWRFWLDELFLHPRWGLLGSMAVFAAVLFVVFEISTWIDLMTSARLVTLTADWQPTDTFGVVMRAVLDGMIGLVGIVVPYMIPLVLLLVALEESGIMQRIAFVVDRVFHHIGLHGAVALPFLLGLGCNVPAISAVARSTSGRERVIASVLITFVPCSARSAIILAIAGKYLGGFGVFGIFMLTILVITLGGHWLARRLPERGPGQVLEIPAYSLPTGQALVTQTWARTSDVLTIVTPLLVAGSVVLALLKHVGADAVVNTLLFPVTSWWLGLPVALGVPILFGVLRKELSLLMIYQALGSFEIGALLNSVQIVTFLVFLTFYIPCVSTFAVMLKTIGRRDALYSLAVSVGVALAVAATVRWSLTALRLLPI